MCISLAATVLEMNADVGAFIKTDHLPTMRRTNTKTAKKVNKREKVNVKRGRESIKKVAVMG